MTNTNNPTEQQPTPTSEEELRQAKKELRDLEMFHEIDNLLLSYTRDIVTGMQKRHFPKEEQANIFVRHRQQLMNASVRYGNTRELEGRIQENKDWLTVLAPAMDYNTADNDDFNKRINELTKAKEQEQ